MKYFNNEHKKAYHLFISRCVLLTHLKSDLWNFPRATLKCEISIVLITACLPCCLN